MNSIHYQPFHQIVEQYLQENLDQIPDQNMVTRAFQIHQKLVQQIQIQIEEDRLLISSIQKPFKLQNKQSIKDPVKLAEETAKRLHQIKQQKQIMEKQLLRIQLQQQKVKNLHQRQNPMNKYSPQNLKNFKSQINQQDGLKLKALRMAYKKFQKDLQQKNKKYEDNYKKFKHQQRQLQQKQMQEKCQQRKAEIQKHMQMIVKRQQQRQKKLQRDKQLMNQLKLKKKLFEEMQKKWKAIQDQQQKRKQQLVEQRKKMQNMDYQSLKEHKKKYFQLINKQKQERQKRMAEINKVFGANSRQSNLFQSRLFNVMMDEQSKKKAEEEDRKNIARAHTQKKLEYAQIVRVNHKPKAISKKGDEITDSKKQQPSNVRSFSSMEIQQKGNAYMKQASKNVSHLKVNNTVFSQDKTPFKYKDYLKQMGRTTKSGQYPPQMVQIKKLMKDSSRSQYQKFERAKIIAERLDSKKNKDIDSMVGNINTKLQILKQIAQ